MRAAQAFGCPDECQLRRDAAEPRPVRADHLLRLRRHARRGGRGGRLLASGLTRNLCELHVQPTYTPAVTIPAATPSDLGNGVTLWASLRGYAEFAGYARTQGYSIVATAKLPLSRMLSGH